MAFLHDSAVEYHGRLKSSNVLVDSRWTCKVADMGLRLFREGERSPDSESNIYFYSKLKQNEVLLLVRVSNRDGPKYHGIEIKW